MCLTRVLGPHIMSSMLMRAFWLMVLLSGVTDAQTASGTILGVVRDSQQAAVPGAKVTATNIASNTARHFTTDQTGQYTIPFLLPGRYSVSVEAQGFRRATRSGLTLRVDD